MSPKSITLADAMPQVVEKPQYEPPADWDWETGPDDFEIEISGERLCEMLTEEFGPEVDWESYMRPQHLWRDFIYEEHFPMYAYMAQVIINFRKTENPLDVRKTFDEIFESFDAEEQDAIVEKCPFIW